MVRALDLLSGGPGYEPSTLLLIGFVLGFPKLNSSAALCIEPNVLPLASWDF